MPWSEVMGKYKRGELHSGSPTGKPVKSRAQAIAVMLSEKKKADSGDEEYQSPKDRLKRTLQGRR